MRTRWFAILCVIIFNAFLILTFISSVQAQPLGPSDSASDLVTSEYQSVNALQQSTSAGEYLLNEQTLYASGTTHYVAPTGYDSENSCLVSSAPCQTVGWAVEQAGSGDVIKIAAGVYTNPDMSVEGRLVVLDQTLTLAGGYTEQDWDNPDPIANPTILDGQNLGQVVYADTGGITVTLSGLQIQGGLYEMIYIQNARLVLTASQVLDTDGNSTGIYLSNSDGSEIWNSQVTGNSYGLRADSSDYLLLKGNTFSNNYIGIDLSTNNTHALLEGNTISANNGTGVNLYIYNYYAIFRENVIQNNTGIGVYFGYYYGNDYALFENNLITGNQHGIYTPYGHHQITFKNNFINENAGYGIYWGYGNNLQVLGNTLAGNGNVGFYLSGNNLHIDNNILTNNAGGGLYISSGSGVLRHNTIADNGGVAGVRVDAANPVTLVNNIIAGHNYGLRTMDPYANVQADHTLWFNNSHDTGASGGVNIVTTNDVYGDPAFVGGTDPFAAYHITASSAAIDVGVETTLTTDIDGEQRAPDIGADEYPYVLNLIPDHRQTVEAGSVVTYVHSLRNSGSLTDTVSLSATSSQGWSFSLTPLTATLSSGEAVSVTLVVNVPAGTDGQVNTTLVTATSANSPTVQASIENLTMVGLGVQLEPDQTQSTEPGAVLTYTHEITNIGATSAEFELSIDSSRGWATLVSASPLSLGAGESAVVLVQVQVPLTATAGLVDTATMTASSTTVPEVYDTAVDVTMVAANQGTRFVAPTGTDSENSCLVSSVPCQTVGWAVEQAGSGDVIKIATGIYTNPDMNVEGRLVVLGQTVTLVGGYTIQDWDNPDPLANPTVLDGQNLGTVVYADTGGITVTLSGLQFQGGLYEILHIQNARLMLTASQVLDTDSSSTGIYLSNSDGSQIVNNQVTGNYYGMRADSSDYVTVSGSTFNNNYVGIDLSTNNTHALLEGNTISANNGTGVNLYIYNYYAIFRENVIQNNTGTGVYFAYYYGNDNALFENNLIAGNQHGIYAAYSHHQITFQSNIISDNTGYGLYWGGGNNLQILGNTLAGNGNAGLYLGGSNQQIDNNIIAGNGSEGIHFAYGSGVLRHNTIADNGGVAGVRVDSANPVTLINNIIAGHSYGVRTMDPYASLQADHTLWFNNSHDTGAAGGVNILTTNNVYGDPAFVGGTDPFAAYHIRANSGAIDAGVETTLTTDIDGEQRAPDIGADEFPYVLTLEPDYRQTVEAGSVVTYVHTLRNSGSLTDTVSLSAISSQDWVFSLTPLTATLSSGEAVSVTLVLNIPAGVDGAADTTLITATSTISPSISAPAEDVTIVGLGVQLEPNSSQSISPGGVVTYTHSLTNLSSIADTYEISISSERGWTTLVTASLVSLDAGESTSVIVRVSVPLTAAIGTTDLTMVTATSINVPEVYDTVQNITTVSANQGTRYVAPSGSDSENSCLVSIMPCQTVGWAVEQAGVGDVIKLATGVYTNPNMTVEGRLVVVDQTLTLAGGYTEQNWDSPDPIANPSVLNGQGLGMVVYAETSGITVTLSGLQIQGGLNEAIHIQNAGLVLTNSQVLNTGGYGYGVYLSNSDDSQIVNSQLTGNAYAGVYADTSDYLIITGNTFSSNSLGVNLSYNNTYALLEGNTISDNSGIGINVYVYNSNATFRENVIQSNTGIGVYFAYYYGNDYALFDGNLITGNQHGIYTPYSHHQITFQNNVISDNAGYGLYWGGAIIYKSWAIPSPGMVLLACT